MLGVQWERKYCGGAGLANWGQWNYRSKPAGSKIVFQSLVRLRNHPAYPMSIIHVYDMNLLSTW